MLHFDGVKSFTQPPEVVWRKLSDARFLVECIPGVESTSRLEQDSAVCILRPGFSFVRGTLELTVRLMQAVPDTSLALHLHTKGIGSTSDAEVAIRLEPHEGGTQVQWTADVKELGGLLKAVPQGLAKAAAQKVIADAWAAVDTHLRGIVAGASPNIARP